MATPPLVHLRGVTVSFGARPLFEGLDLALGRGERAALVGRNGSGKSTLMKLLSGDIEPDRGDRFVQPGTRVVPLSQEPVFEKTATAIEHVTRRLDRRDVPPPLHRAEAELDRVGIEPDRVMSTLSGGETRRVDLAAATAREPDVLLLDEPTNHLDLPTIERMESWLAGFPGAILVVSHDRAFLDAVANRIIWLDRGTLRATDRPFREFDDWAEVLLAEEEKAIARLETKIAQETHWLHRGVTARRKRNQGRLRKLGEMRQERAAVLGRPGHIDIRIETGDVKSRAVIEAEDVAKSFTDAEGGEQVIVRDFSTRIMRGDRVGVIGPNGAGKTTLIRMLTGEEPVDSGRIRVAKSLTPAYFDQRRERLDLDATPWSTLCPEGGDNVMVRGQPRHVVGYLKEFLFAADQVKSPLSTLSGGERNRLLLARILASPTDLLVLDEPTNDLDMDTLDLLEEALADYAGTLLVVSHDRDFLDRVATSTIVLEGDGKAREFPGGYSDYRRQRKAEMSSAPQKTRASKGSASAGPGARAEPPKAKDRGRLSYKDQRTLDQLPERIEAIGRDIAKLEATLADPNLYARDPARFEKAGRLLEQARATLASAEDEWLDLETKREAVGG